MMPLWRGLLTEEEVVRGMVDTWARGYAVLTIPTAYVMAGREWHRISVWEEPEKPEKP